MEGFQIQLPDFILTPVFNVEVIAAAEQHDVVVHFVLNHVGHLAGAGALVGGQQFVHHEVFLARAELPQVRGDHVARLVALGGTVSVDPAEDVDPNFD